VIEQGKINCRPIVGSSMGLSELRVTLRCRAWKVAAEKSNHDRQMGINMDEMNKLLITG